MDVPISPLQFKSILKPELAWTCYLLSFPLPAAADFLAPATKNIFPDDPRPPLLAEAERKDCWKDLWITGSLLTML